MEVWPVPLAIDRGVALPLAIDRGVTVPLAIVS